MKKLIIACLLAVATITGCSSSSNIQLVDEKEEINLTFSWWGKDSRHDYTIAAIKEFEKQNPNIKVNLQYSEYTGFQQKTNVQLTSHTEADVMQLEYAWVNLYSPNGEGFYDLNTVSSDLNLKNYSDVSLGYGTINSKINALPIAINGKVFIYNKDIYDNYGLELPKTWDDLYKAAEVMSKDGIYPFDVEPKAVFMVASAYMEQKTGKPIIDENDTFNFTEAEVQGMIDFYVDMIQKGVVQSPTDRDESNIKNGTTAGSFQWIINAETYKGFIEGEAGGTMAFSNAPVMDGATRSGWYVKPATMYSISKNTKHPKEAAQLLEFLVSSPEMNVGQGLDKGIPANEQAKKVLEENSLLSGSMYDADQVVADTETNLMRPSFEDSALSEALNNAITDVLYGKATSPQAAHTAYETMKAYQEDLKQK